VSAQKLGQLQPFVAVLWYSRRNAWAGLHLLGQPDTFLAQDAHQIEQLYL
jgi:hypothetical protein